VPAPKRKIDIRRGLALDFAEREALQQAQVRASSSVQPIRQTTGNLILRCSESGGGKKEVGHFVGFLPLAGYPFSRNDKVEALGKSFLHRTIFATALVRFEVFRYRENFLHAWITLHRVESQNGKQVATRYSLFRGRFGSIQKDGQVIFPSETGEADYGVPEWFRAGFDAALNGSRCPDCQHSWHFEKIPPVLLPEAAAQALHIDIPKVDETAPRLTGAAAESAKRRRTAAAVAD
jgi:hypothetical protein